MKYSFIGGLALLSFLLTSCSGSSLPSPTTKPTTIPTPEPTNTQISNPTPTMDPEIYFIDDFSQPGNWYLTADPDINISRVNGYLAIAINSSNVIQYTDPGIFDIEDLSIEADITTVRGDESAGMGLSCRITKSHNYNFEISGNGLYSIYAWDDILGYTTLIDWTESSVINTGPGAVNHLTATCDANQLSLSINGVLLETVNDIRYSSGSFGVFASKYETPAVEVQFDNFLVTKPKPPGETQAQNNSSGSNSCLSPGSISAEHAGQQIEVCGEITNWGDVACPDCPLGGYSYLILDEAFTIISYEWIFNNNRKGDCVVVADEVEMLGNDPVFVYGAGEGYSGSECSTVDGSLSCSGGDYFQDYNRCQ